jgi:drug/metabolite transporter (DMT)-like permease
MRAGESSALVSGALVAGVVAISFAAIFFRLAAPTHPLVAAGIRLALASIALAPLVVRSLVDGRFGSRDLRAALAAGFLYGLHFGMWVWSLSLTSVAASVTLVTATPIILALLSLVTGRDRPDRRLWAALVLACTGVLCIGGHDLGLGAGALVGDALALGGAVAMALYLLLVRGLGDALDVWAFMGVATMTGATLLLGTACWVDAEPVLPSRAALGWLALAALVPQLVGHGLLTWVLRHASPTTVGIATLGEPVGAAALGWLLLGEEVALEVAFGSVVVLVGVGVALDRSIE